MPKVDAILAAHTYDMKKKFEKVENDKSNPKFDVFLPAMRKIRHGQSYASNLPKGKWDRFQPDKETQEELGLVYYCAYHTYEFESIFSIIVGIFRCWSNSSHSCMWHSGICKKNSFYIYGTPCRPLDNPVQRSTSCHNKKIRGRTCKSTRTPDISGNTLYLA